MAGTQANFRILSTSTVAFVVALSTTGVWSVAPAAARDIFVSNTQGDDRAEGNAPRAVYYKAGPVRTIAKAFRLSQAGDRIILHNSSVPYREEVSLIGSRHGGSPIGPLVIEGNGATLDGSMPIPTEQWKHHVGDVFVYQPVRQGYQQLFLAGHPAVRRPVQSSDVTLPDLEPLEWCFWNGKIYFRVEGARLPEDFQPSCCALRTGLTLYYVGNVVVRDLVLQGYQVDGVAVHDVVRGARLERVVCRANGRSGVSVKGASIVELDQCYLEDNGASQLRVTDFAHCWLYKTQLNALTAPAIEQQGGQVTQSQQPFVSAP